MPKQLPGYFKDYLDEKFSHTNDTIKGVDGKVNGVKNELKRMNGDLAEIKKEQVRVTIAQREKIPIFDEAVKGVKKNTKNIRLIAIAGGVGGVVCFEESREFVFKALLSLF